MSSGGSFPTGMNPNSVAVGDLDGDGKPEIAVTNFGDNSVSIFHNVSGSTISFESKIDFTTGTFPGLVNIADIDGDGRADLILVDRANNFTRYATAVSIFHNLSMLGTINSTSFESRVDFLSVLNNSPLSIAIADIDGDGKVDVVTTSKGYQTYPDVSVFRNTSITGAISIGSFESEELIISEVADNIVIQSMSVGDLDLDGKPDILVSFPYYISGISHNNITVIPNTSKLKVLINPVPGNLCNGSGSLYATSHYPNVHYVWSNGETGSNIHVNSTGTYTVTATNNLGATATASNNVVLNSNCGGYLELISDSIVNYFDTIHLSINVKGGLNLFSAYGYLHFDSSKLRFLDSQVGNYLGTNILYSQPIVTNGTIDFGLTQTSGQTGSNGDGNIYNFRFLVNHFPDNLDFNPTTPTHFPVSFNMDHINCYNSVGIQPPSFSTLSYIVDTTICNYYIPVWPGDLNNDHVANVADILPIGYFYGMTGPIRPNGNLSWIAQPSPLWAFSVFFNGINSPEYWQFADGNADGIISLADQAAIGFNLGKVHSKTSNFPIFEFPTLPLNTTNTPSINVNVPDTLVQPAALPLNELVNISIGSPSSPLNNLYGVAFDLYFDPAFVNTAAITTDYAGSIFGTQGVNFTKIEDRSALSSGRLSIGITRFNTTNITGNGGTALNITFPLLSSAPGGWFKITSVPVGCNDNTGNTLSVTGSADSLRINAPVVCSVNYWSGSVSSTWENPANWSCGSLPDAGTTVYIDANKPNYPIINSIATCKQLFTAPNTSVIVKMGFRLDIVGQQ